MLTIWEHQVIHVLTKGCSEGWSTFDIWSDEYLLALETFNNCENLFGKWEKLIQSINPFGMDFENFNHSKYVFVKWLHLTAL